MLFRYRPARPADFKACLRQARDLFAYAPPDHTDLVAMWTELLIAGRAHCPVIEDSETGNVPFFALLVFVDDATAQVLYRSEKPMCTGYLLQAWRSGSLPFLTREQIRVANATAGVNLLCITSGMSLEMTAAGRLPFLLSKINEYHPYALGGFRMNAIYVELYDETTHIWGETFGYNRLTDYAALPDGRQPRLYGITAAQARAKVGSAASTIFHYSPPRFGFSPLEQEFLLWALSGDTDDGLAANLHVATVTVRKRWGDIYTRVADVQPDFFGYTAEAPGKRGGEKKRRLLAYLEHHIEELRPYNHPVSPDFF